MEKEFKTIEEQVEILKKRNLILQIERKINTYIAYEFSKSYGHKNYLLEDNFDNTKDLFSIVIILKKLLPKKDFEDFYKFIILDIENLKKSITSININKILYNMGFPKNYTNVLEL